MSWAQLLEFVEKGNLFPEVNRSCGGGGGGGTTQGLKINRENRF